jgi:hypothetical protein
VGERLREANYAAKEIGVLFLCALDTFFEIWVATAEHHHLHRLQAFDSKAGGIRVQEYAWEIERSDGAEGKRFRKANYATKEIGVLFLRALDTLLRSSGGHCRASPPAQLWAHELKSKGVQHG